MPIGRTYQSITPPRFFLAHAKSCTDADLDELIVDASKILDRLADGRAFNVTLGREFYEARFKACGSWEAWCNEVATGVEYGSRSPLFKAILVPDGGIGAATAKIVEAALGAKKPVIAFKGKEARRVVGITRVDAKDWVHGWRME
jgi:hypothetical protein